MDIQLPWKREEAWNEKDRKRLTREEIKKKMYHSLMSPPPIFTVFGQSALFITRDTMKHHSINTGVAESSGTRSRPDSTELDCPKKLLWLFIMNWKKANTSRLDAIT